MRVASESSIAHVLSVSRAGALPCNASASACSIVGGVGVAALGVAVQRALTASASGGGTSGSTSSRRGGRLASCWRASSVSEAAS